MGKSKDYFGPRSRGNSSDWVGVSHHHRCPVCNKSDWCRVSRDGETVMCRRISEGGRLCLDARTEEFYVHKLSERVDMSNVPIPPAQCGLASLTLIDQVYRHFLGMLELRNHHRAHLLERGLSVREIEYRQYRSMPIEGRSKLAKELHEYYGDDLSGVPGFCHKDYWTVGGSAGIVIPLRNLDGLVVALKVRRDDNGPYPKYSYLSASKNGGPCAVKSVHAPLWEGDRTTVVITEGELKADVCTVLGGVFTLSIPGVGSWRLAVDAIKELRPNVVRIAFDNDPPDNVRAVKQVSSAKRGLYAALSKVDGLSVGVDEWSIEDGKGLDDVLLKMQGRAA